MTVNENMHKVFTSRKPIYPSISTYRKRSMILQLLFVHCSISVSNKLIFMIKISILLLINVSYLVLQFLDMFSLPLASQQQRLQFLYVISLKHKIIQSRTGSIVCFIVNNLSTHPLPAFHLYSRNLYYNTHHKKNFKSFNSDKRKALV